MTNPTRLRLRSVLTWGLAALIAVPGLTGCSEEPPPPPKKTVRKPPPPPPPKVTTIEELMARHGIDDRIVLDESTAPGTDDQRVALMTFFNGFATAQPEQIRPFLGPIEQEELDRLIEWGDLDALASSIEEIEIFSGAASDGRPAVFAMYWLEDRGEGQMWIVDRSSGPPRFEAAPAPPGISAELGENPFEDWFAVVDREKITITEPDLGLLAAKAKRAAAASGASDPNGPGGGAAPPPKRTPAPGV